MKLRISPTTFIQNGNYKKIYGERKCDNEITNSDKLTFCQSKSLKDKTLIFLEDRPKIKPRTRGNMCHLLCLELC
jgi:hypothetical protein